MTDRWNKEVSETGGDHDDEEIVPKRSSFLFGGFLVSKSLT